jgi:beta-N-acetylhexosaminidase
LLHPLTHSACIVGCMGTGLGDEERAFFRDVRPWGFTLFGRNIGSADEVRALTDALREAVDDEQTLIFIDQEGGRVQRLKPPLARRRQASAPFGALYARDPQAAIEAVRLNYRLVAQEMRDHGVTADFAPCIDLLNPEGHGIVGDRAFSANAETVSALGRAACDGLLQGGVAPVIKHMPGHGRAKVDSHLALPTVETDLDTLDATDFAPFRALNDAPMGMTAHVVYAAADPNLCLTVSKTAIDAVVRGRIAFDGLLMSDDLSMKALGGDLGSRAARSVEAGCDVVLHGNGALVGEPVRDLMTELAAVARNCGQLSGVALRRAQAARASVHPAQSFDIAAAEDRLASLGLGAAA